MLNRETPFFRELRGQVEKLGGAHNAHLHLDRYATLEPKYTASSNHDILGNSHISLHEKHALINSIHLGPAYQRDNFFERVSEVLDQLVYFNTFRADTMVDVTADNVGLQALQWMNELKAQYSDKIDLRCAAYSPFGFRDDEPQRWDVFAEGIKQADFIGALPEADDIDEYPEHIGFDEHCRRVLELGVAYGKEIHVHTDQRNEQTENGTERLVQVMSQCDAPVSKDGTPMVWAVHMISPSTYDESRFQKLVEGLLENNIGVICCPSAAIGMRQYRPVLSPTYNSIPRVLELLAAGVHVRVASDNIADICSPSTTADWADESFMLSAAVRFYHVGILAKIAAGKKLDKQEREFIQHHLDENDQQINEFLDSTNKQANRQQDASKRA